MSKQPDQQGDPLLCITSMRKVYVVIRVIFFFAVNARNKKTVRPCNFFFAVSRVSRVTRLTAKKKITRCDGFFVTRIYSGKKKLHDLPQKKKITRCDDFFLHAFTTKIQKLHNLTTKEELSILLKNACL